MSCQDCVSLRVELATQKEFMSQWFEIFFKQMETMEEKLTNQTNDLKKDILEKMSCSKFQMYFSAV